MTPKDGIRVDLSQYQNRLWQTYCVLNVAIAVRVCIRITLAILTLGTRVGHQERVSEPKSEHISGFLSKVTKLNTTDRGGSILLPRV